MNDILFAQLERSLLQSAVTHAMRTEAARTPVVIFVAAYDYLITRPSGHAYTDFQKRLMANDGKLIDKLREYAADAIETDDSVCADCGGSDATEGTGELGVVCEHCGRKTMPAHDNRGD